MVDHFNHIEPELARRVAGGLGLPVPAPIPGWKNHGKVSPALSMLNGPKSTSLLSSALPSLPLPPHRLCEKYIDCFTRRSNKESSDFSGGRIQCTTSERAQGSTEGCWCHPRHRGSTPNQGYWKWRRYYYISLLFLLLLFFIHFLLHLFNFYI